MKYQGDKIMKKNCNKPYNVNHRLYICLTILFTITLFISLCMPDDNWYQNIHDILNNLSYGCIASVVVAWLIDCANVNNQNKKSAAIYNLVFEDLKGNLVCFIGTWANICYQSFNKFDYHREKHTWIEWYDIFKENYEKMEDNEEKCKIIEDVSNKLQLSIKSFKASYHELMSEQFLLATNELINLDLRYTLRSIEQEFAFLDYQLHVEDSDKIKLLNIVCKNIEFYINQWDDIKHFNSVSFSPQKFYLAEKGIG